MKNALKLSDEQLKKIQQVELEIMIEFDRICRLHDIQYSLDGGSLLGAIRHKGFIPWDDDIDVIMLRSEYEKFAWAAKTDLQDDKFFLDEYRTDEHYRWGYEKLRRKDSAFVRLNQEHLKMHSGIFIDIMVADRVPDGRLARKWHLFQCFCIRKLQYSEVGKVQEKSRFLRMWYSLISKIPVSLAFRWRNHLADKWNKKETELVSHLTYGYPKRCKYGMPAKCFTEFIDVEFEGRQFKVFKDYDTYLKLGYGDYMELPPVEERYPHLWVTALEFPK